MHQLVSYRHEIIWGLLLIFLPFSTALINIALVAGSLLFIYESCAKKIPFAQPKTPFVVFFVLILFLSINAFVQGGFQENQSFYRLYPLLIATYFALINISEKSIISIKKISVFVAVSYVLISACRIGIYYVQSNQKHLFGNSDVINHLLILERPYAGCFALINIVLLWDLFRTEKKNKKAFYLVTIIILTGFIILIAARLSLLSLLIIAAIYIVFYAKINRRTALSLLLGIPLLFALSLLCSKGLQERLFVNKNFETFKDYEPRFVIWKGATNVATSDTFHWVIGTGNYQDIENKLITHYEKIEGNPSKKAYYLAEKFNTHNQFIDLLLFGGVSALFIFLFVLGTLFVEFKEHFTALAILLSLILFMLVENIFHRQTGCYLFMIYLILASKITSKNLDKFRLIPQNS